MRIFEDAIYLFILINARWSKFSSKTAAAVSGAASGPTVLIMDPGRLAHTRHDRSRSGLGGKRVRDAETQA